MKSLAEYPFNTGFVELRKVRANPSAGYLAGVFEQVRPSEELLCRRHRTRPLNFLQEEVIDFAEGGFHD